jgi:gamma-glutamyltranspeptidase / glutathione hydrolase
MAHIKIARALTLAVALPLLTIAQERSQSGLELEAVRPMVAQPFRAPKAVIASVHELATEAGLQVLRDGGNAVDAAVTVAFVLGVVHPEAGNLGGSGFLLASLKNGKSVAIDYGGIAPGASKPGMFQNNRESSVGYKSIAIPGTPAGMGMLHAKLGKLSWKRCLEPARKLAKDGFPASLRLELILKLQVPVMKQYPESARVFLHGGTQPLQQGEKVVQPDLAATIARMQKHGWREFYEGETAKRIAADMAANGGVVTEADLKAYQAAEVQPLETNYRGHRVLTMPHSSSGGVVLLSALNTIENFELAPGQEGSARVRHLQAEALRLGLKTRREVQDEQSLPVTEAVSKGYAKTRAALISSDKAITPDPPRERPRESPDTTHFTVVDGEGNMVANTYTLSGFFGSQVVAKGTGVLLNNHMSVFAGYPRTLKPGNRYLSAMAPTIVFRTDGTPWLALGTPGGMTIPSTIFQVISNVVDFKMSLRDAIEFPRIHFDQAQQRIDAEPGALVLDVADKLKGMGHRLNPRLRAQGDVSAILIEEGSGWRVGWADGRRGGAIKGF